MSAKTDPAASDDSTASSVAASASPSAESPSASSTTTQRKPRFAIFIATAAGLGYLPKAPGTWGSVAGILIYVFTRLFFPPVFIPGLRKSFEIAVWSPTSAAILLAAGIAVLGVWSSSRVARHLRVEDPQCVVIDEVSGQHLTYLVALAPLNWKYLLLGFILFRVFDIWKPFPARQAESLPGGWGIMADDWIAGIYAAIGLWLARSAGL
jgi:phosphatidylglycerophosphatase A